MFVSLPYVYAQSKTNVDIKTHVHTTQLQKGLQFYNGKSVTFVSPDSPGGGFDQYARTYAPFLAHFLHASVNVEDIPAGNTIAGQDFVAHASPNGLTVGWLNVGADVEDVTLNLPALNFNPIREAMLGGSAPSAQAMIASTLPACNPWASWASVVRNSSASNPVSEITLLTGSTTFVMLLSNGVFGVHAKSIFGYPSVSAAIAGFTRGDGCLMVAPIAQVGPLVQSGRARPLLLSAPMPLGNVYKSYFQHTPTVTQAAKQLSKFVKTRLEKTALVALIQAGAAARVFFTASATPAPEVAALKAAFKWASLNKNLQAQLIQEGNPPGFGKGPVEKQNYETFLNSALKVTAFLKAVGG